MNTEQLAYSSIATLIAAFRTTSLSPVELLDCQIARIERSNGTINAFTMLDLDRARQAARDSEQRWQNGSPLGPLDGVTFAAKDNQSVRGYPTRCGSLVSSDALATETSPAVARCLEAGAVFIGLATMPEYGTDRVTNSPLTGITRNPWNTRMHCGGSSGGPATVVSAGYCTFAIGSDAGGSIRIPAAFTGVIGMKGTGGRVPIYPVNVARELSCVGPLAHDMRDIALLMNLLSQPDPRDPFTLPGDGTDYVAGLDGGVAGLRIAWSLDLGIAPLVHPEIRQTIEHAVERFAQLGAITTEAHPGYADPITIQPPLLRAIYQHSLRDVTPEQKALMSPTLRGMLETPVTIRDYMSAQDGCRDLARQSAEFFVNYDLLVTPTVATPTFPTDRVGPEEYDALNNVRAWSPFTGLFNLTQQPAISIPAGLTSDRLPIGMQIVGPRGGEATIMRVAHAWLESAGSIGQPSL
jgi:aspartyl-tRNA(Asn)/glutamyl-tRNA(Gln) amidotransferase subunit A